MGVLAGRHVGQSSNLQGLRGLEEVRQLLLANVHLTVVHEPQQRLHVALLHVSQDHNGVLAWVCLEHVIQSHNLTSFKTRN